MPLPLFLIGAAFVAGVTGLGVGLSGAVDMSDASEKLKKAKKRHQGNMSRLEGAQTVATQAMDELGRNEMEILSSFKIYSDLLARIQDRPRFEDVMRDGELPRLELKEVEEVSVGASVLLGGIGAATIGALGGFAASGATTSAVVALGTASTGTAISSLSGVAATNATLAALGGGSLAAGGGGMALASGALGGPTRGVGLLVGGIIFRLVGRNLSGKADQAWEEMLNAEQKIKEVSAYLNNLASIATDYNQEMQEVRQLYEDKLKEMAQILDRYEGYTIDWNTLPSSAKVVIEQATMLVGLLYAMCRVKIVKSGGNDVNEINHDEITEIRVMVKDKLSKLNPPQSI